MRPVLRSLCLFLLLLPISDSPILEFRAPAGPRAYSRRRGSAGYGPKPRSLYLANLHHAPAGGQRKTTGHFYGGLVEL